jgi:hypothetical protein
MVAGDRRADQEIVYDLRRAGNGNLLDRAADGGDDD